MAVSSVLTDPFGVHKVDIVFTSAREKERFLHSFGLYFSSFLDLIRGIIASEIVRKTDYAQFTFPSARKKVTFNMSDGTPHAKPVTRTVKLSGKMNIVFTELEKNKIQISVNSRYILDGKSETHRFISNGWTGYFQPYVETFSTSFNTSQPSEECTAKNILEKMVLDKIEDEIKKMK